MSAIMAAHMLTGFYRSGDFTDEEVLIPLHQGSTIRINLYQAAPQRLITANCAKVISANNDCTNGVVHVIDRVMPIPKSTIADLINSDPQFSILKDCKKHKNFIIIYR